MSSGDTLDGPSDIWTENDWTDEYVYWHGDDFYDYLDEVIGDWIDEFDFSPYG